VLLLKELLKLCPEIFVGSLEESQGQERKIVIISLVRSLISVEGRHNVAEAPTELGFLSDVRRTNVLISRAQRLVILVGDLANFANSDVEPWLKIVKASQVVTVQTQT
jgi:superfamily I DNA and/or RNA helicase